MRSLAGSRYTARSKHPASVMFLGAVTSTGEVSPPIWFPQGLYSGSAGHSNTLDAPGSVCPWRGTVPVPAARKTLNFLREEQIPFWMPEEWTPNSPDLNPLDYAIWSMVVQGACKEHPPSVTALKKKVSAFWKKMADKDIRAVCRCFRPWLEKCVAEKGPFFD